jgi:hypothetical protein
MSLRVLPASLEDDQREMIEILDRNIPGADQEAHFRWRHECNPAGPGWSWILRDGDGGSVVAMASLFPRKMYLAGKAMLCGRVGEFVIDATHRSLGPAVLLQRATFGPVNSGELALCYDCPPHERGMSTFLRLGMQPNCEIFRYAFPLRSDEFVTKKLGTGVWTKPVAAATNLFLGMRVRPQRPEPEISFFEQVFDDEFSRLDANLSDATMIRASRSADELNWSYRSHPVWKFRTLVARRAGELQAFLAYMVLSTRASVVDLFGRDLPEVGLTLLQALIEICHREKMAAVEGYCSEESDLAPLFKRAGFRRRERGARVVAYAKPDNGAGQVISNARWALNQVDMIV